MKKNMHGNSGKLHYGKRKRPPTTKQMKRLKLDDCKEVGHDPGCGTDTCIDTCLSLGRKLPSVASQKSIKYKEFRVFKGQNATETEAASMVVSDNIALNDQTMELDECPQSVDTDNDYFYGQYDQTMELEELSPQCHQCDLLYVFIDLETSGFSPIFHEILQISAITNEGVSETDFFDIYVLPERGIPDEVTNLRKLTKKKRSLYLGENEVPTVSTKSSLDNFLCYLQSLNSEIVLVGHQIGFDLGFLYRNLQRYDLWNKFKSIVHGTVDTIPIFRRYYPGLKAIPSVTYDTILQVIN